MNAKELRNHLIENNITHITPEFFDGESYEASVNAAMDESLFRGVVCANYDAFSTAMKNAVAALESSYTGRSQEIFVKVKSQSPTEKQPTHYGEFPLTQL